MENVKLDLIPGRVMPICHASQYDVRRVIRFNLVENDVPYVLDGTETVTFDERKIDGNVVTAACTVTATKSYVDLETTEQMCACYGQNLCELKIEKGSDIIGTLNFVLDVERDPLEGGIQSESEIYNLQVQINEIIRQELENYDIYGAYVTEQISGAIVNFTDGADNVPVKALSAEFSASQASGTPTPSTPIPIVGVDKVNVTRTGKNLLPSLLSAVTVNNITFSPLSDGAIDINGTASGNASVDVGRNEGCFLQAGTYYVNKTATPYTITVFGIVNGTVTIIKSGGGSFTLTNPTQIFVRVFIASGTAVNHLRLPLQIELGSTAYEPYNGTTALINLGGTYYGGSVDAVTGKITLTHRIVSYTKNSTWTMNTSGVFYVSAPSGIDDLEMCNYFEVFLPRGSSNAIEDGQCRLNSLRTNINFKILSCETLEDFKTWLGDNTIQVVYSLATPIVVYASNTAEIPTILGVNNIFSDAGDVDVTYRADTALYIDKRLNA